MKRLEDARETYLAIAARRFAADGYHGASLDALARDAGVTKQAFLHFFGSKQRLYAEVLKALAARQCAEIDAYADPDPARHLEAYFRALCQRTLAQRDDARLVVRALLDIDDTARTWPMKSFLDRLVDLARRAGVLPQADDAHLLAWVFQMIGAIQYLAISLPAISGMYGAPAAEVVAARFDAIIARNLRRTAPRD